MNNTPVVSVIIPVYNAGKYLRQAFESALACPQTGEIILVEDGSRDNSLVLCKEFAAKYKNVKLLRHPEGGNHGAGASRNLGINNASCPLIAFLDADDFYLPNRFEKSVSVLSDPKVDGVYEASGRVALNENALLETRGSMHELQGVDKMEFHRLEDVSPEMLFEKMVRREISQWNTNTITLRKASLNKKNLRFDDIRLHQDTLMWLKCAYLLRLMPGSIDRPVAVRTYHGENRITGKSFESKSFLERMIYSWALTQKMSYSLRRLIAKRYSYFYQGRKLRNQHPALKYPELLCIRLKLEARILLAHLKNGRK